ncbi:hypothetical protein KR093_010207, partial [Drosophila rubida]
PKPSEALYIHCQDALQEQLPRCVLDYRRLFSERVAKSASRAVKERRQLILKERVDGLRQQAERVRQVTADYHARRNNNWRKLREHCANDMEEHLLRRGRRLNERVETLRTHNDVVQRRCELLRYGNYLRRI